MKQALSLEEIGRSCASLRAIFLFMREMKKVTPLASAIKLPQVPAPLSESLVVHLIEQGRILPSYRHADITRGGGADITIRQDKQRVKIEVKGTGEQGFQRMRAADMRADYLVWVHFGAYFRSPEEIPIVIYVIPRPRKFYRVGKGAFIHQIRALVGKSLSVKRTTLRKIGVFVGE